MPVTRMFMEDQSQADGRLGRVVCETPALHDMDQNLHTGADPQDLISVSDYERLAEQRMDPGAHGYYAGGAGDELTLADNVAAWRRLAIAPRVLVGVGERDTSV